MIDIHVVCTTPTGYQAQLDITATGQAENAGVCFLVGGAFLAIGVAAGFLFGSKKRLHQHAATDAVT